jgi:hypothetical protein
VTHHHSTDSNGRRAVRHLPAHRDIRVFSLGRRNTLQGEQEQADSRSPGCAADCRAHKSQPLSPSRVNKPSPYPHRHLPTHRDIRVFSLGCRNTLQGGPPDREQADSRSSGCAADCRAHKSQPLSPSRVNKPSPYSHNVTLPVLEHGHPTCTIRGVYRQSH